MRHRAILFEASWRTQLTARAILRGRTLKDRREVFGPGRLPVEGAIPCRTVEGERRRSQRSYRWCGSGTESKFIQPEWSSKGVSLVLCVPLTASGPSAFPRSRNSLRVVTDRGQMRHRVILFQGVVADSFGFSCAPSAPPQERLPGGGFQPSCTLVVGPQA
ncbi:hypothetical protein C8F04DRAFT_1227144 [Mycena alexandri]|uniref:Uncharacterized protein n=1 Tax=Mycena alexandri TaxID=1745969 RepID=A0AAD6TLF0_9AGAR|nr:hypothetical protein C8F04DRAFT_1227144 [Mycena alexandri]